MVLGVVKMRFSSWTSSNDPKVDWVDTFFLWAHNTVCFPYKSVTTTDKVTSLVVIVSDTKTMKAKGSYSDPNPFPIRIKLKHISWMMYRGPYSLSAFIEKGYNSQFAILLLGKLQSQ